MTALEVPQLDRGNHLSYGYQWIAFGIMAPLGLGYFVWSELRERRRAREEEAALHAPLDDASPFEPLQSPAGSAPAPAPSAEVPSAAAQAAPQSRRTRSRYGDSKPDFYEKIRERGQERF